MWVKTSLHCPVLSPRCKVWLGEIDYQPESFEFGTHYEWIGYQIYSAFTHFWMIVFGSDNKHNTV